MKKNGAVNKANTEFILANADKVLKNANKCLSYNDYRRSSRDQFKEAQARYDELAGGDDPGISVDLQLPGMKVQQLYAYGILYGVKQALQIEKQSEGVLIPGLRLRDYPFVIIVQPH